MNQQQIHAVQSLGLIILETVSEAKESGAPAGVMYAALMKDLSLNQFQQIMGHLMAHGFVTAENDCYTITPAGEAFLPKLRAGVERSRAQAIKSTSTAGVAS